MLLLLGLRGFAFGSVKASRSRSVGNICVSMFKRGTKALAASSTHPNHVYRIHDSMLRDTS